MLINAVILVAGDTKNFVYLARYGSCQRMHRWRRFGFEATREGLLCKSELFFLRLRLDDLNSSHCLRKGFTWELLEHSVPSSLLKMHVA